MNRSFFTIKTPAIAVLAGSITVAALGVGNEGGGGNSPKDQASEASSGKLDVPSGNASLQEPAKPSNANNSAPAVKPELRASPPSVTKVPGGGTPRSGGVQLPELPGSNGDATGTDQLFPPEPSRVPANLHLGSKPEMSISSDQRLYSIGKVTLSYATKVREDNKELPSEKQLLETVVSLIKTKHGMFRKAVPETLTTTKVDADPALERFTLDPQPIAALPVEPKGGLRVKRIPPPPPVADDQPQDVALKLSSMGAPQMFSAMAVQQIYDGVVKQLNEQGIIGVYLLTNLDSTEGASEWVGGSELKIELYVSQVKRLRTVFRPIPFKSNFTPLINDYAADGKLTKDPKHAWILSASPIHVDKTLEKKKLQDFLSRLNRFPGRRVDSAINATSKTGEVTLDYLVREQKPYGLYLQTSNTGTQTTGELRHRIGFDVRQLANKDDILRFEYVTSDLSSYNSGFLSYEIALKRPDYLKLRTYVTTGNYSAEDVGVEAQNFSGESLSLGAALSWTPLYWRNLPVDITLGVEWLNATVENTGSQSADGDFLMPYIGVGTDRATDKYSFAANLDFQFGVGSGELDNLGRFATDDSFFLTKWNLAYSTFLEPVLMGKKWGDTSVDTKSGMKISEETNHNVKREMNTASQNWKNARLANEIAISSRGQYVWGDKRIAPQLESVIGGAYTVRGYPESFTPGDSSLLASLEYRLHIPRLLMPYEVLDAQKSVSDYLKKKAAIASPVGPPKPGEPPRAIVKSPEIAESTRGSGAFKYRPATVGGNADWDLIFRAFADYGQTVNNNIQATTEADRTLLGVGAGLELQLFRPSEMKFSDSKSSFFSRNADKILPVQFTLRADIGFALLEEVDILREPVNAGDNRIHISGALAW